MKVAWATDIHWTHADKYRQLEFLASVADVAPDVLFLTGDIAEGSSVCGTLTGIRASLRDHGGLDTQIAFVLGNHDYYGASVSGVRTLVEATTDGERLSYCNTRVMHYLTTDGPMWIGDVAVVGVDGWGDGRHGDLEKGRHWRLYDWDTINDLKRTDGQAPVEALRRLAAHDAMTLANQLIAVAKRRPERVLVLTHVPPWPGASWHMGKVGDDYALPWFTCRAVAEVLEVFVRAHPNIAVRVLCGHTHSPGHYVHEVKLTDNMRVKIECFTGHATYQYPKLTYPRLTEMNAIGEWFE